MRLFFSIVLGYTLFTSAALAAWSSSGGGELSKDVHNPWFLHNTTTVTYCVIADSEAFHLSMSLARQRVKEALEYWRSEFAKAPDISINGHRVRVATQQFRETDCEPVSGDDPTVDLRFQLGILGEEQRRFIGDPTQNVALAIRTNYEKSTMRGRGFIYIAADAGPLRPQSDRIIHFPWTLGDGSLLLRVLAHELGHVFGLPDGNDIPIDSGVGMMSKAYPENILDARWAANLATSTALPNFFKYDGHQVRKSSCSRPNNASANKFFGIPLTWRCLDLVLEQSTLHVYARATDEDINQLVGRAELGTSELMKIENVLTIWLPLGQTVFQDNEPGGSIFLWGPQVSHTAAKGTYRSSDGRTIRKILVHHPLETPWFRISGVEDGELKPNL